MAPGNAPISQLNGHYANQYPNHNNKLPPTHLTQNKAYTHYMPSLIIALSALYVLAFVLHYLFRKCRKYGDRKQQREKQELKLVWTNAMTKFELLRSKRNSNMLLYPHSAYNKQESYNSSASSFTLNNYPSPSTVTATHIGIDKQHQSLSPYSSVSSFATATTTIGNSVNHNQHASVAVEKPGCSSWYMIFKDKLVNYWRLTRNKKLTLLWQWSVAMGYSEYNHAKNLDDMVLRLQRYQEFDDDKHTVNEDDIAFVDE
ncbi:hypothetical protein BD408DRAFT_434733 [Parasitella parasitica]|nr:hypothetical protein BD408DRAFT_434733 [Parasitella parasitica]